MITPMTFQDALNDFLEKEIASKHKLKSKRYIDDVNNTDKADFLKSPNVIRSGWILPNSIDEEDDDDSFPYITTRIEKVENVRGSRESIVTMLIIFGIYDPGLYDDNGKFIDDGSGYRDFWNLVEATRQALFQQMTIDNKYRIIDDFFEAEMLSEQVYPYWEGFCKTKWHVLFPVPKLDECFYKKGD